MTSQMRSERPRAYIFHMTSISTSSSPNSGPPPLPAQADGHRPRRGAKKASSVSPDEFPQACPIPQRFWILHWKQMDPCARRVRVGAEKAGEFASNSARKPRSFTTSPKRDGALGPSHSTKFVKEARIRLRGIWPRQIGSLQNAQAKFLAAGTMITVGGELAAGAAHEMKQPPAVISGQHSRSQLLAQASLFFSLLSVQGPISFSLPHLPFQLLRLSRNH